MRLIHSRRRRPAVGLVVPDSLNNERRMKNRNHLLQTPFLACLLLAPPLLLHADDAPKQKRNNAVMLAGEWLPGDPHQIDHEKLPRVTAKHAVISDVRDQGGTRVHQHAYLAHHDGRFWAMWSDGPGLPATTPHLHRNIVPGHDRPGTRNSFATSKDGLHWTTPADLTGPPRIKGYGWIARGLWKRDGELLALASHFNAPGYTGRGLSLEAFRWSGTKWVAHGTVLDDSLNNFPPKRLPSGEWMMTRRDHQRQVSVMIGGTKAFNDWRINPLAAYDGNGRPEEPYWYVLPDGKTIVGLIRDNGGSKFLLRTFSRDNGKTWSEIHRTNFPDATSKFFVHRTSRGYYVMVSNSNPRWRDPLTLAISQDGLVFTKLFWLIGGRHIDYPHIIEHDGHLLIAFSGAKQTMEVMKVSLDELERLAMPASVELDQHLPPPQQPTLHWIDLGDEGKTLYAAADLVIPELGKRATFSLATAGGEERVVIGIDEKGCLTAGLYKETVTGLKLERGSRHSLLIRLHSHREKPDELFVGLGPSGKIPAEPESWTLSNSKGSSAANLSRVVLHSAPNDSAGFENVRIAPTREGLATAKVVAKGADDTAAEREFEAVLARFRSGTVTLPDGRQMNWHRRTGTGPSLVLIPGTWGDLQSFATLLAELPGDMSVIVVELCWQGGLVPKRTDFSIEELADDVLQVVDKLNTGDFFISGHSIGGMITVEIAGRNVRGLRGAIPMEGWTHHSVLEKAFAGVVTAGLSPEQQVRRNRDRARGRGHLNSGQLSAITSIWGRWNGAASLERSQVPILHIWGDRGRPRPDRSALQIPDRPQIEIAWIRDASHAVTLQAPKAVATAIVAFMAHHAEGAEDADVIVYGGTPGGLAAAIAAARLGSRVIVVEPNLHVGGMTTSGLGKSDIENRAMIGGIFHEFVKAQRQHYRDTYGPRHENIKLCRDGYYAEPSVSEAVFEAMLAAENKRITVLKGWRLADAHTSNDTLKSITILRKKDGSPRWLQGKVFIDATYEGDLYAAAGAEYRLGREARDEFDEPHAGVVYFDYQQKKFLPGTTGEASQDLPAFTYRLCLTKDPKNSHKLSKPPPGYDRSVYRGYFDDLKAGRLSGPKVLKPGRGYNPLHFDTLVRALSVTNIPNDKADVNMNPRPLGFPFTEENRGYIEGDEATRDKIRERIRNLTLGLIWFLQNDAEVPANHRKLANELHFPKDEFTDDKEHFPFQLYVREGRRLVGEITLTEHHITGKGEAITHHPDTIAIGEFPIDSFPCRKRQPGDTIVLEGYLGMLDHITRPYEIPYRVMIPKNIDGLIVPVAASTTHVAFSSIRMEPTWMALGQAAGTAARLAIEEKVQPRDVPIKPLQATLRKNGQVLSHIAAQSNIIRSP